MTKSPKTAARRQRREARTNRREQARTTRHARELQQVQDNDAPVQVKPKRTQVVPLTEKQADYDDAIRASRITFGVGPAGTGKTYFATMRAAQALDKGEIEKIYLTRPAVEAGESLGFLPGELEEKYEPYLRPFRDALEEYFGTGHLDYLLRKKIIEPVPLGFLRGATIKNAWMLADEMQNATKSQMKMLLTRMGNGSKFIVNGDPRQADIPMANSGLEDAVRRLSDKDDIEAVQFSHQDVVRDDIVATILEAYDD